MCGKNRTGAKQIRRGIVGKLERSWKLVFYERQSGLWFVTGFLHMKNELPALFGVFYLAHSFFLSYLIDYKYNTKEILSTGLPYWAQSL